jgi:ABC-type dipeptide/oligopeptide/nickel transport system permease component
VASLSYAIANLSEPLFPLYGYGWDKHLIMPVVALMTRPIVQIAKFTSSMLTEELSKQYVVVHRSTGHTWRDVRWRLSLKNVTAGVILTIARSVRFLIVEVIVVEWLFGWPGLGRLFAQALVPSSTISMAGVPTGAQLFLNPEIIAALLMSMVGIFMLTDLFASFFAQNSDPRLRREELSANG